MTIQESTQDRAPVTVVGLGPMGAALAGAFLNHGHPITVWNRSRGKADNLVAQGAHWATTVTDAVTASTVIVVCVKDYETMYAILEPAAGALAGRVVVNLNSGTPEQARAATAWATERGIEYLDGAIMVPPPLIGLPGSVLLYSGPEAVFAANQPTLTSVGSATYLGTDPGLAVLYNTALLGLMYSTLNGFLHAAALVGTAQVGASTFAEVAIDWFLPSVVGEILETEAPAIDKGHYPGELGSMQMNLTALDHIVRTSVEQGVDIEIPSHNKEIVDRAITAGFGANNYMAVIELLKRPTP
jgi:3-hydroxyisobutyrate dehydrogenase-like beta-hydroxyacid dehydrogenase